jgi:PAS domain S-box-containing protein/putative nucleotidyltransferase with HDIG domain
VATLLDLRSSKAALQQVETLAESIEDVSLQLDLDDTVHKVLAAAARVCDTGGAAAAVLDDTGERLYYRWHIGEPRPGVADRLAEPFPADRGIAGRALQSGQTQVVDDYPLYASALPSFVDAGIGSVLAIPLNNGGASARGVLSLWTVHRGKRFSPDQIRFAEALARQLGVAIQRQRLVDDVRRSSERLAQVFTTVPDILFVMRPKTLRLELVSPVVTELLGFLPEEFTDEPGLWQRQIHADDRERVLGELRAALAEADGFTLDLRVWHKDGHTLRWFEGRAVVERDETGRPKRLVGALSDITLRRQAQQALEAQRNFVTAVLDTAPSLIVVLDRDGRVVNWNRACEALTGLTVDQVRGQPVWEFLPEDLADDAKTEFGGLVHQGAAFQRERVWLDLQGTPHIIAWSVSILTGAGGEVTHLIASGQDVSAQRRAEKKVEQLARFAAENPNPVLRTNRAGRLLYANDASEPLLRELGCTVGSPMPPSWCRRIERALRDGGEERFEIESGGRYFLFSFSAANDADDINVYGLDVTERHESALQLRKVNRALTTLSRGNEAVIRAQDEPSLLRAVCANIAEQGGYRLAWVGFCGEDSDGSVAPVASAGPSAAYVDGINMRCTDEGNGSNPIAEAIRTGRPVISRNMQSEPVTGPWRERAVRFGFSSCIALPLTVQGEVIGVLAIYADEADAFDQQEQHLLGELAGDLAYGVGSLRTHAERDRVEGLYRQSLVDTIQAIALTVEKRDPYTAGHQQRVADLSAAIAAELNFDLDRIEGIRLGALIHDIGKIYIPSEILNRPGRLSEPEFELIKTHPAVGYDIVKDVHFPWPVADMILQHHERLDGSGYPSGLRGDEILPEAKIMAVADVVEAITSHRPYRPGLGLERARKEIRAHRGSLYWREAVDACLRVLDRHEFSAP